MNRFTSEDTKDRAVILGEFIAEHRATVRATAKKFGISKSTVHIVYVNPNGILL